MAFQSSKTQIHPHNLIFIVSVQAHSTPPPLGDPSVSVILLYAKRPPALFTTQTVIPGLSLNPPNPAQNLTPLQKFVTYSAPSSDLL